MEVSCIRNFVIIAHIDHGKSTLADRLLELTGTVEARKLRPQHLDQMELEREKGITIKMQPVRMMYHPNGSYRLFATGNQHAGSWEPRAGSWQYQSNSEYILNLIDTPGHADFTYEVSRALAAVEGAVLLVDASQGIQAQTISNFHLAALQGLVIIPVINKIDLPGARVDETAAELAAVTGGDPSGVLRVSAKTGAGVAELLDAVTRRIPPPRAGGAAARALIFDSQFDAYRGVIAHVRMFDGAFRTGDTIRTMATGRETEVFELGSFAPALAPASRLAAGEIGYLATGLKDPDAIRVGDTLVSAHPPVRPAGGPDETVGGGALPGYREPQSVVFASAYPEDADDYERLSDALAKMKLSDAAIVFEPESSEALGRGFRMGFLGLLHLDIIGERLRREHGLGLIFTTPSVAYRVAGFDGGMEFVYSAARLPDARHIREIAEPWVRLEVIAPVSSLGALMELLSLTRGRHQSQAYLSRERIAIVYEAPLRSILVEFSDALKRVTAGYGSHSYEFIGYRPGDLVRLDVLIAGERQAALADIVPQAEAYRIARRILEKLKEFLPRQLFAVSIQAAVGGRIIARETLPALKKDVTGYLYGGDRTRKMKLWEKQQRGKKRLKKTGRVRIPPEVFLRMLKTDQE